MGITLIYPHIVCIVVSTILMYVALFNKLHWCLVGSVILLVAAIFLCPMMGIFVLVPLILCIITYSRLHTKDW